MTDPRKRESAYLRGGPAEGERVTIALGLELIRWPEPLPLSLEPPPIPTKRVIHYYRRFGSSAEFYYKGTKL